MGDKCVCGWVHTQNSVHWAEETVIPLGKSRKFTPFLPLGDFRKTLLGNSSPGGQRCEKLSKSQPSCFSANLQLQALFQYPTLRVTVQKAIAFAEPQSLFFLNHESHQARTTEYNSLKLNKRGKKKLTLSPLPSPVSGGGAQVGELLEGRREALRTDLLMQSPTNAEVISAGVTHNLRQVDFLRSCPS